MVLACLLLLAGQPVSVATMLPEMTDLARLARRPSPWYTEAQASSFDRNAYKNDPFANGDAGQYLRQEGNEYVMADLKGPGAVVRIWSANPGGTIRFYFDGEKTPRLKVDMADLLNGKAPPLRAPFAYNAAQGTNLYFPFPYAKSLKVTAEGKVQGLYYQINYRTFESGTTVKTFENPDLTRYSEVMGAQARRLLSPDDAHDQKMLAPTSIEPGKAMTYSTHENASSAVRSFLVKIPFPLVQTTRAMDWDDSYQPHNVLRSLIVRMWFNGEKTVEAPLGDFFGTSPGLNPHQTLPIAVREDGTMISRWVMPFNRDLKIEIQNVGKVPVPLQMATEIMRFSWDDSTYLFHAQWQAERTKTRPMKDMHFLDVQGEGRFVGSNLHIANPTTSWWGEGDEKFYVDGETQPSTFGTGTEDYYGYAWCSPALFSKPYHAQPRCDGPGNMGHTNVQRWQILDSVPFRKSFKMDMEMWHWADVEVTAARTTFWYAKPGTTPPMKVYPALLLPPYIEKPRPVEGALEGEDLKVTATGGDLTVQQGFIGLSNQQQRWWIDPKIGDTATLIVPVKEAGTYEIVANLCHARDYGIHKLTINGQSLGIHDFYDDAEANWRKLSLGKVTLPTGDAKMVVECVGQNPKALPAHMFGLDYLLLRKQ